MAIGDEQMLGSAALDVVARELCLIIKLQGARLTFRHTKYESATLDIRFEPIAMLLQPTFPKPRTSPNASIGFMLLVHARPYSSQR